MANDLEQLVLSISADTRQMQRAMKKLVGDVDNSADDMNKRFKKLSRDIDDSFVRTFQKAGSAFKEFFGGLAAGIFARSFVDQVQQVVHGLAEIGDKAKISGLSIKSFQELGYVARVNRIEVDALTDGMKEMLLRADEFIQTGKGSGAESFQRLGLGAADLAKKLHDPSALFTEIIGKLQKFDKAAQIRIADELFGGTGGERFVQLIEQGEQGIRDQIKAAHDLGVVFDGDVIKRAAEIDKKFGDITLTISGWVQPKVISFLNDVLSLMDRVKPLGAQMDSSLDAQLSDIGKRRLDIENQIRALKNGDAQPNDGIFGTSLGASTSLEAIQDLERENDVLAENERRILDVVKARQAASAEAQKAQSTWTPPTPPPGGFGSSPKAAKAPRKTADDKLFEDIQAVQARIAAMREEQATLGISFEAQTRLSLARQMEEEALRAVREEARRNNDENWKSIQLSQDQKDAIDSVASAYARQADELRKAQDAQQLQRDMLKGAFSDLRSAISDGKLDWKDLANVATNALERVTFDVFTLDLERIGS